jgi:hypothetical protein
MPVALSIDGGDGNLFANPTSRASEIAPSDEVDVRPRIERCGLVTRECRDIGSLVRTSTSSEGAISEARDVGFANKFPSPPSIDSATGIVC